MAMRAAALALAVGCVSRVALAQAGGLTAWGESLGGIFYQSQGGGPYLSPPPLYGAFIHSSSGYEFSVAVRANGRVMGWGGGFAMAFQCLPLPSSVTSITNAVEAHAGFDHGVVLMENGSIKGWGSNNYAQNGNFNGCDQCLSLPTSRTDPTTGQQVPMRFHSVSAGEWINIGIFKHVNSKTGQPGALDRTLVVWGKNEYQRLQIPAGLENVKFKQAVCGGHHVLVLDVDGNISSWGYYYYPIPPWNPGNTATTQVDSNFGPNFFNRNPSNSPSGPYYVSNYVPGSYGAIAAGHHVDYGFLKDGKGNLTGEVVAFAMSNPLHGAMRIPSGNGERYEFVSAGYYQGMGIKRLVPGSTVNNGKLIGWYNAGDPPTYTNGISPFPEPPAESAQQPGQFWKLGESNSAYQHTVLVGCYANCDGSTGSPALSANDFMCFINEYACMSKRSIEEQISSYVNCDGNTAPPILTSADFTCFTAAYARGECKPNHTARPVDCAPCCPQ